MKTKTSNLKFDYTFLVITLLLLTYGLIVLYSASTVESFKNYGTTTYYITHQLFYGAGVGLIAMYVLSKIDYHFWQNKIPIFIVVTFILLLAVRVPHLGVVAGGAHRWITLGPLGTLQPSELAKLTIVLYLASWFDKKKHALNDFYYGFLPTILIIVLFSLLILWQPDLGTMLVLLSVSFAMLFTAGVSWKYFFWSAAAGLLALYGFIKLEPYRARRLITFFNPSVDPQGISYQINQALLAIGSGMFWGYGYGMSRQKYSYLPETISDSIFAILAEELGFIGVVIAIALFLAFAFKGFAIAKKAPDTFGRMIAFGITCWIVFQAFINIGAIVNLLPLTGIPLPFFSYGSTALILNLGAVGIMLNISRQSKA